MKKIYILLIMSTVNMISISQITSYQASSSPCLPKEVVFSFNGSTSSYGGYYFEFGDGQFEQGFDFVNPPTHLYESRGTYYATINYYDIGFQNLVFSENLEVLIDAYYYNISSSLFGNALGLNENIEFELLSNDENITTINWESGNGSTSTGTSAVFSYSSPGIYDVTATINSAECQTVTKVFSVEVVDLTIDVSISQNCAPTNVIFEVVSSNPTISYYQFIFPNGSSGIIPFNSSFSEYQTPGENLVTVIVYDDSQNYLHEVTKVFYINGSDHSIENNPNIIQVNEPVNFTVEGDDEPTNIIWNFGDGNNSNDMSPVHIYNSLGDKIVTATFFQSCGTEKTISKNIFISDIDFEVNSSSCDNSDVNFVYTGNSDAIYYNWDIYTEDNIFIGNYTSSSFSIPLSNGNYLVTVSATNSSFQSLGQKTELIEIGGDISVNLTEKSCESFTWIDGNTYTESGVYTHVLPTVNGCDSTLILDLTIGEPDNVFLNETACSSFYWDAVDESYSASGVYTATLTNQYNCDSIVSLNLEIINTTEHTVNRFGCEEYTENGITYTETGTFFQTLTNSSNCDSLLTLNITITPSPVFEVSIEENILSASNGESFQWLNCNANYLEIENETENTFEAFNGYYAVDVTALGCTTRSDCYLIDIEGNEDDLSINNNSFNSINVFPNPVYQDFVTFSLAPVGSTLRIYNPQGKLVYSNKIVSQIVKVNTSELNKGIYFIRIDHPKDLNSYSQRLIIQ